MVLHPEAQKFIDNFNDFKNLVKSSGVDLDQPIKNFLRYKFSFDEQIKEENRYNQDNHISLNKHYEQNIKELDLNFINVSNVEDMDYLFSSHFNYRFPCAVQKPDGNIDVENIEFSANLINPIFDEWRFDNVTTMKGFFKENRTKDKNIKIAAPKLQFANKMFFKSHIEGDVVIESDCLLDVDDIVLPETKVNSLSLPLNNLVSFGDDCKHLFYHEKQQGYEKFVENILYLQQLLSNESIYNLSFLLQSEVAKNTISNPNYQRFLLEKEKFKTTLFLNKEKTLGLFYAEESENIFLMLNLLRGDYQKEFKNKIILNKENNCDVFKKTLYYLLTECKLNNKEFSNYYNKIKKFAPARVKEENQQNYLNDFLLDMNEILIECGINMNDVKKVENKTRLKI